MTAYRPGGVGVGLERGHFVQPLLHAIIDYRGLYTTIRYDVMTAYRPGGVGVGLERGHFAQPLLHDGCERQVGSRPQCLAVCRRQLQRNTQQDTSECNIRIATQQPLGALRSSGLRLPGRGGAAAMRHPVQLSNP
eukprot:1806863-Pyramimonas_sp.AAC.1